MNQQLHNLLRDHVKAGNPSLVFARGTQKGWMLSMINLAMQSAGVWPNKSIAHLVLKSEALPEITFEEFYV